MRPTMKQVEKDGLLLMGGEPLRNGPLLQARLAGQMAL